MWEFIGSCFFWAAMIVGGGSYVWMYFAWKQGCCRKGKPKG